MNAGVYLEKSCVKVIEEDVCIEGPCGGNEWRQCVNHCLEPGAAVFCSRAAGLVPVFGFEVCEKAAQNAQYGWDGMGCRPTTLDQPAEMVEHDIEEHGLIRNQHMVH